VNTVFPLTNMTVEPDNSTHAGNSATSALSNVTFIARMHQAAYDVLFNKNVWRDPSYARRSIWTPKMGVTQGGIQGYGPFQIQMKFICGPHAWPLWMGGTVGMPDDWWIWREPETPV